MTDKHSFILWSRFLIVLDEFEIDLKLLQHLCYYCLVELIVVNNQDLGLTIARIKNFIFISRTLLKSKIWNSLLFIIARYNKLIRATWHTTLNADLELVDISRVLFVFRFYWLGEWIYKEVTRTNRWYLYGLPLIIVRSVIFLANFLFDVYEVALLVHFLNLEASSRQTR